MSYNLYTTRRFDKAVKRLPPDVWAYLKAQVLTLQDRPLSGEPLKGKFSRFRSLHASFKGTQYRVLYRVKEAKQAIDLLHIGSRENFYREVARLKVA